MPPFAAEVAAGLDAPVEPVVLDPPDHLTAPGGWFDDASRLLFEQATCPVIVPGPVEHPAQVGEPAGLVSASH